MRIIKTLAILAIALLAIACNEQKKETKKETVANQAISKIEVIDFHSTHRCFTCKSIEANTKYTLDTYFAKELANKKITFQIINVDKPQNEKIAEKFEAAETSLFLNVIRNGKETQINLTNFAFMKGTDKEAFSKELKEKIDKELKTL